MSAISKPGLPDYLAPGLRLVVVGFNPGTKSARLGHYYAGPGNVFWPFLHQSGLAPQPLTCQDDFRALEFGIGLTDLVKRPTPSSADLTGSDKKAGKHALLRKLNRYAPRVVCFNGKGIYEYVCGHRVELGVQTAIIGRSRVFVMPSTSARNGHVSRRNKLGFFRQLERLVDSLSPQ